MIWTLEGGRAHLIPTVHFLSRGDYPIRREYSKAYTKSDVIVFESDWWAPKAQPAKADDQETVSAAGDQLRIQVEETLSALGLAKDLVTSIRPQDLSMRMTAELCIQEGCSAEHGLDAHLRNRAIANGKAIKFLEGPAAVHELTNAIAYDERIAALRRQSESLETGRERFRQFLRAWRTSDVEHLTAALSKIESESPALWLPLISGRNACWLPEILRIHASGERAAICVGAFHCVGERRLPSLLKREGIGTTYQ